MPNDPPVSSLSYRTEPIDTIELSLHNEYLSRDGEPLRPGRRVHNETRGDGVVERLGNLVEQRVYVKFDSGTEMFVPSRDLWRIFTERPAPLMAKRRLQSAIREL